MDCLTYPVPLAVFFFSSEIHPRQTNNTLSNTFRNKIRTRSSGYNLSFLELYDNDASYRKDGSVDEEERRVCN